jgi:hypothetical protein
VTSTADELHLRLVIVDPTAGVQLQLQRGTRVTHRGRGRQNGLSTADCQRWTASQTLLWRVAALMAKCLPSGEGIATKIF